MPSSSSSIPAQRLPAPSLFVAPPSHNTSNLDLSKLNTQSSQPSTSSRLNATRSDTATIRITPSAGIPGPTSPLPQSPHANQEKQPGGLQPPSPTRSRHDNPSTSINNRDNHTKEGHSLFPPPPPTLFDQDDPNQPSPESAAQRRARRPTAILDAHWAALQSTLSDIELSASGPSHVFGPNHASALEDLRRAQVELARAWGPRGGSADESLDESGTTGQGAGSEGRASRESTDTKRTDTKTAAGQTTTSPSKTTKDGTTSDAGSGLANTSASASTATATTSGPHRPGDKYTPSKKETDADLDAAERRRTESDAYFQKVKQGVADVVRRLEGVSMAMRDVEMESREIWGEGELDDDDEEEVVLDNGEAEGGRGGRARKGTQSSASTELEDTSLME